MYRYLILMIFAVQSVLFSQNQFQTFVSHIYSLPDSMRTAAVDSFMIYARGEGIPFIDSNKVTFLYRGSISSASIAGDFTGWEPSVSMSKLSSTNLYYHSRTFEMNARLDYKFVINNNWILDPENPHRVSGGFGPNSELAMPKYVQPWEINYNPSIPHGTSEIKTISSNYTNTNYQVIIYLPPNYIVMSQSYPAVYFQDGSDYRNLANAFNVLDNLIDSNKIEPVIGIFVVPTNRNEEYAFSRKNLYEQFFINELVPWVDSNYHTIKNADARLVLGDSFGGNISAMISYNHPEVFANCGLHSAAFWPNNYEVFSIIANGEKKNIRYSSIWGTYESLFDNMRDFRDIMISKGYEFDWLELPEGHSWGLWRATLDNMLINFFPYKVVAVEEKNTSPQEFELFQNYPNPFNPITKIKYAVGTSREVSLRVYNLLGKEAAVLVNEVKQPGEYEVEFDGSNLASGVYLFRLTSGGYIYTIKTVLMK